jgi:hypothetical protein
MASQAFAGSPCFGVNRIKVVWDVDFHVADMKTFQPFTASGDTAAAGPHGTAKFYVYPNGV